MNSVSRLSVFLYFTQFSELYINVRFWGFSRLPAVPILFYSGPIFRFVSPQGQHVAPIMVKFGRERTLLAKFHLDQLRIYGPKNFENLEFYQYNCC